MNNDLIIDIKPGVDLNDWEVKAIDTAKAREWGITSMTPDQQSNSLFVLLKNKQDEVLAQGQLIPINGIEFNNETFNILGIGGIISNTKGKGYGRKLMDAIKDYLTIQDKTGIGFTGVPDFYQKCGFLIDQESIKRFVHIHGNHRNINDRDKYVLYLDSTDELMKKVLHNLDKEVYLPRDPNW